ncbi:MAG TPA: hypothetical protein VKQ52_13835 [Puia sp.]|nr:hypothetical protein [Puia sp.]
MKTGTRLNQALEQQQILIPVTAQTSREDHVDEIITYMQDMERRRLAIALRDNINQVLAAARIFAGLLEPMDEKQQEIKNRMAESLALAIGEIGKLTDERSGSLFLETGLIDSINTLIDEVGLMHFDKIRFTCHNKNIERLQTSQKIVMFRIIRESLEQIVESNLLKDVELYLQFTGNRVLIVFDGTLRRTTAKNLARSFGLSYIGDLLRIYNGAVKLTTVAQKSLLEISILL